MAGARSPTEGTKLWQTAGLPVIEEQSQLPGRDLTQTFASIRSRYAGGPRLGAPPPVESPPPLGWVQAVSKVDHAESCITGLLRELELEQQEHIRAQTDFDGEDAAREAEASAKRLTAEIVKLFQQLDVAIHRVVQDADDTHMLNNVQRGLAGRVNTLHMKFKQLTNRYGEQLKRAAKREDKARMYSRSEAVQQWEKEDEKDTRVGQLVELGYTQMEIDSILVEEQIQREKAKEILNMQARVEEIHDIFKDIHVLVVDQGTMLDTIQMNISNARATIRQGTAEVRKAREHQKKCCVQ